jgi:tetratricopeptide (TPR) repeat protein
VRCAWLAAACFVASSAAILSAQSPDRLFDLYSNSVHAYQSGDVEGAAKAVVTWSERDLRRIAPLVIVSPNEKFPEAAAMLHMEIVLAASGTDADLHLRIAETLVTSLPSSRPSTPAFQQRWYALAASLFLSNADAQGARSVAERGVRRFGRSPQLVMLLGIASEMAAHQLDSECSRPGCEARGTRAGSAIAARLSTAEGNYRRALEFDSTFAEARLRLGRILFLQDKRKSAREELEATAKSAVDARLQYLAHLFLGELDKDEGDLVAASREYAGAMRVAPEFQTPYVALSFVEQMLGHTARARETLDVMTGPLHIDADDPWWAYEGGAVDGAALEWLRAAVR